MRFLLASTGIGALAAVLVTPAAAETVISTAVTTPVTTSGQDIRISSTGSVKPSGGAAVTINSNNYVKNEGAIAIKGANGSTGILANANLTGDITNSGTITLDEDFTPTDSDNDGDLDGPFAQGTNRYGIRVQSGGTHTGNITNSGTITIEGNQSAGIAVDSALNGSVTSTGKISVLGNDSFGVRTGAVAGSVTLGAGSTTTVQGQNSIGLLVGGDVGGVVQILGSVSSTGYRSTTAPSDTSKLDADDLLQGGSAVAIEGSVAGGILIDTAGAVTTFGAAPALRIGSASQDINIGPSGSSTLGHGLVIKGLVSGSGVYSGINATGVSIGGTGHAVNVAGGMTVLGIISAKANNASATGIHVGAGATVPQMVIGGSVSAQGGGTDAASAQAILIDAGATVNSISNSGTIAATRTGDKGTAGAIVDKSGTLALVENSGAIGVTNAADIGDKATAIDLHLNTTGAVVRQIAAASGKPAPVIAGSILFGTGNDTLDIQAGSVTGKVDFGGGTDVLLVNGGGLFRGTLLNTNGLSVGVGGGSTLDVQNLGTVNLASLTTAAGANLGVTIGTTGHTLYNVAGTASFGTGTKILVTLDRVGTAAGTYTIIDAGTLTGGENLSSSIVTLPFLFTSKLTPNSSTGQVALEIQLKGNGELGLNSSEVAILDAALDAADFDKPIAAVFLNTANSASLKTTLQQLMPEHAGGAFEAATKGSRLAAGILSDPRRVSGLWAQQVAWGSSKSIGNTSSYDVSGWGVTGGYDYALGSLASVGLTGAYLWGKDGKDSNELVSHHYEGGLYLRGGVGPVRAWARATAGTINFDSSRNFTATIPAGTVARTADGEWKGRIYSGTAGLAYEARMGRLSIRPNASIDYYKLTEKGYTETGGGDGFDLTVRSRKSNETAANAMLSLGYDLLGLEPDEGWLRFEVEGGRRQVLSGKLGKTVASFGDGTPFTLSAEERTSGWRGGARILAGGSAMTLAVEGTAEEQQGKMSLGGRLAVGLGF